VQWENIACWKIWYLLQVSAIHLSAIHYISTYRLQLIRRGAVNCGMSAQWGLEVFIVAGSIHYTHTENTYIQNTYTHTHIHSTYGHDGIAISWLHLCISASLISAC